MRVEQLAVTRQAKKQLKELGNVVEVKVVDSRAQTRYGGSRLKLERRDSGSRVPKFNVGESIALDADDDEDSEPIHGILKKVFLNTYEVELEISESVEVFKEKRKWDLMKRNDNASFKQMEEALKKISLQASPLRDVLLGLKKPSTVPVQDSSLLSQNNYLDPSQRKAVQFALRQRELAVIHGPPGTGKTTTLVEIVRQAVRGREKVLVTAGSHVAVDNIGEKLAGEGLKILRLGHPARVTSEAVLEYSLGVKMKEQFEIAAGLKFEFSRLRRELHSGIKQDGVTVRRELKRLKKNLAIQQVKLRTMREKMILEADVVLGTLIGCGSELSFLDSRPGHHFHLTIIDECGQSLEMACWIVIPRAPKLILAGDHHQLPPTVVTKSKEASAELSKSLMERVLEMLFYGFGAHMLQVVSEVDIL